MRRDEPIDLLEGSIESEALGANAKLCKHIASSIFAHLDNSDSPHAVWGVEATYLGLVIPIVKQSQVFEMRRDLHEGGNHLTYTR